MTTKASRHAMVEVKCEWCGIPFMARKQRVDKGQGRWCSLPHYKEWLKAQGSQRKNIGKENAIVQWDKSKNMYVAYWFDSDMKYNSTGFSRWYWELNVGEIPTGYYASYKDGDSKNISPENLCLKTMAEISDVGDRVRGIPKSAETRKKLSVAHTGKKLSEEHRIKIGDATRNRWNKGMFDSVHIGEHHHHWRGGVRYTDYPLAFHKIKQVVRERDNQMCQICGTAVYRSRHGHVHHISGDKQDNSLDNLILVCSTCHGRIHSKLPAPPTILAFRSKLEWNKP